MSLTADAPDRTTTDFGHIGVFTNPDGTLNIVIASSYSGGEPNGVIASFSNVPPEDVDMQVNLKREADGQLSTTPVLVTSQPNGKVAVMAVADSHPAKLRAGSRG